MFDWTDFFRSQRKAERARLKAFHHRRMINLMMNSTYGFRPSNTSKLYYQEYRKYLQGQKQMKRKSQITLKPEALKYLITLAGIPLVNSFIAEENEKGEWAVKYLDAKTNTELYFDIKKEEIESSKIIEERPICGNCEKNHVMQKGWICSACKHGGKTCEPTKDKPDYDSLMMQNFVLASKLLEELPKDQRARVAKALGILHGN